MNTNPPDHGTLHRRKNHRCGCEPCLRVDRDYANTRTRLQAYGQWQPYVDAQPARDHIQTLMAQGIGWMRIAHLAGVSNGGMSKILYGDPQRGLAPCKRIRRETEQRILAVHYSLDHVADSARIDATGTRRRLQALVAIGWPQRQIAQRSGFANQTINKVLRATVVEGHTARAVRDLYRDMSRTIPESTGVAPRYAAQARRIATALGWHGPLAWDDIDDPTAQPDPGDTETELNKMELGRHRRAEIEHLEQFGIPYQEIHQRLGMDGNPTYVRDIIRDLRKERASATRNNLRKAA